MRVINIPIKSNSLEDKVRKYLEFTYKFHKLTSRETDILVVFIKKYYTLYNKYKDIDANLADKLLFDKDNKKEIRDELNIRASVFQNYLTIFRKKDVIVKGKLNRSYIPPLDPFELRLKFL